MSIEHMRRVFRSSLPPHLRMVAIAIADGANDDGVCWPGQTKLSAKVGTTDRGLRSNVTELVRLGYLEVERRGSQKTNVYTILLDEDGTPIGTTVPVTLDSVDPSDRNHSSGPDRNHSSGPDRNHSSGPIDEPPVEPPVEPPEEALAVRKLRPRNELWDAVSSVFGDPTNDRERGRRVKAVALFRESDVHPGEVATLARVYRWKSKGDWADTDIAVAGRVTDCRRWAAQAENGTGKQHAAAVDRHLEQERDRIAMQRAVEAGPGEQRIGSRTGKTVDWFESAGTQ